jgi:NAD(P)H-hydrate epimerase
VDVKFVTDRGVEVPAVTTAQMREIDRIAIEETGPTLFQMMENAGRNLAAASLDVFGPTWREAHVVVLAGTGGNGGGGIVAARHLAHRGVPVSVVVTDETRLGGVPAAQLSLFRHTGGTLVGRVEDLAGPDLVIDAIIGYGLRSAPAGRAAEMIAWAAAAGVPVVALDVPSGVDATSGEAPGVAIEAHTTLALALPKTGSGADANGRVLLGDLGIPAAVYERAGVSIGHPIFDDRWVVPLALRR